MNHTHQEQTKNANVANLVTYRAHLIEAEERAYPDSHTPDQRVTQARQEALVQLDALPSPAIAYAAVFLSQDGSLSLCASGIEPEFIPAMDAALARLRSRVQAHGTRRTTTPAGRRGFALLTPLLSLAFMAATYVNGIAWLDAAMSLAAQLTVGHVLARRRIR